MLNNNSKTKNDNLYKNLKLQIISRNSQIRDNHKNTSAKTAELNHLFFKRNNYTNPFKYDKLYHYENEKVFSNEIKKQQLKKRKINLKKMSKFHKLLMHDKIQSVTESRDYNDLTLNNRTTVNSEFIPINLSNNNSNNNQTVLLKSSNLKNVVKGIDVLKKKENQALIKKNISLEKIKSDFLDKDSILNDIEISKNDSHAKNLIKKSIKVLNYKFKDIFGNPNNNIYTEGQISSYRYQNNLLSEQMKNKLKYNIIYKIQKDFFLTQSEKLRRPINVLEHCEFFNKQNKNYFLIFEKLLKKYFGYLYSNIENEKKELFLLKQQKENLKEEIFLIAKKINSQKDKKIFLGNLLKLLIKIRYNVDSLDKIPNEYLKKYGIMKSFWYNNYENKTTKKRNSMLITELKDNSYMKYFRKSLFGNVNQNNLKKKKIVSRKGTVLLNTEELKIKNIIHFIDKSPKKRNSNEYKIIPKIPIFNNVNELDAKFKRIEYNLKEQLEQIFNESYAIRKLKLELHEAKSEYMSEVNRKISDSFIQMENEDANIQKEKYYLLSNLKNYLLSSGDNYIEYNPKLNQKNYANKKVKSIYNFSEKLISILLNLNINIEIILKQEGIYKFLNSPQSINIIYNSNEYNKTMFCVKILENIFLYLMEERKKYLSDEIKKEKYLKLEEEIDMKNRIKKLREKTENYEKRECQREKDIFSKEN